jgi:Protein of unknown function (DUF935)
VEFPIGQALTLQSPLAQLGVTGDWSSEGVGPIDDISQAKLKEGTAFLHRVAPAELISTFFRGALDIDNLTGETWEMREAYRRLMLKEPAVKTALLSKVQSVGSLDLQVLPDDDEDPVDIAAANFCKWSLERSFGGIPKIVENICLPALIDGFSVGEIKLMYAHSKKYGPAWTLEKIYSQDSRWIRFDIDEFKTITTVRLTKTRPATPFPPEKFVIMQHLQLFESPFGISDLRAAYRAAKLIESAIKLRAILLENFSGPFLSLMYPKGQQDIKENLEKVAAKARAMGWMVAPEGASVEVINLATSAPDQFQSCIEDLRKEIYTAICGTYLQFTEGAKGTERGNSETHKNVAEKFVRWLADAVCEVINRQLFPLLVKANYGDSAGVPRCQLGGMDMERVTKQLGIIEQVNKLTGNVSKKQVYDISKVDPARDDEDRLQPATPPGGGIPPGAGGAPPGMPGMPGMPPGMGAGGGGAGPDQGGTSPRPPASQQFRDKVQFGSALQFTQEPPVGWPPAGELEGRKLAAILEPNIAATAKVIVEATKEALNEQLPNYTTTSIWTEHGRKAVIESLATLMGFGDMLARARLRQHQPNVEVRRFADTSATFDLFGKNGDVPFSFLSHAPRAFSHVDRAIEYISSLVPMPGVDALFMADHWRRKAFTLAIDTEGVILDKVKSALLDELIEGGNSTQAIQALLDAAGLNPRNPQYAEMVARTNVMDAYDTGLDEGMEDPDVQEDFPAWGYDGIADGREGDDHRPQFGKYYPASVSFKRVRGPRIFNCVLPGNAISGRIIAGLKARYYGEAIEIHTAGGSRLSITPNHPVLTPRGFIAAGELQKGDHVIRDLREGKIGQFCENEEYAPAFIEDVFDALTVLFPCAGKAPITTLDLHGDAINCESEIDVVRADSNLLLNIKFTSTRCESRSDGSVQCSFALADFDKSFLASDGALDLDTHAVALAPPGSMRSDDLLRASGLAHLLPFNTFRRALRAYLDARTDESRPHSAAADAKRFGKLILRLARSIPRSELRLIPEKSGTNESRLGHSSRFDAVRPQPTDESIPLDAEFAAEFLGTFTGEVAPDEIIEVRRFHYDGPVYDVETTVGYYTAASAGNNIVISNCRCLKRPIYKSKWRKLHEAGAEFSPFPDWGAATATFSDIAASQTFASHVYDEDKHPRDDHGRFVSKGELQQAKNDPAKADQLRSEITKPAERAKLDAAIGRKADPKQSETPNQSGASTAPFIEKPDTAKPAAPAPSPTNEKPKTDKHPAIATLTKAIHNPASNLTEGQRVRYAMAMNDVLDVLPKAALDRIAANVKTASFHGNPLGVGKAAIAAALARPGITPEQRQNIENHDEMFKREKLRPAAAFLPKAGTIHLDGAANSNFPISQVYAHALSHAIDGPDHAISNSPEWQAAWKAEIAGKLSEEPKLNRYAQGDPSEGFAEFGRLVFGSNASAAKIEEKYPLAVAALKKHGLWDDNRKVVKAPTATPEAQIPEQTEESPEEQHNRRLEVIFGMPVVKPGERTKAQAGNNIRANPGVDEAFGMPDAHEANKAYAAKMAALPDIFTERVALDDKPNGDHIDAAAGEAKKPEPAKESHEQKTPPPEPREAAAQSDQTNQPPAAGGSAIAGAGDESGRSAGNAQAHAEPKPTDELVSGRPGTPRLNGEAIPPESKAEPAEASLEPVEHAPSKPPTRDVAGEGDDAHILLRGLDPSLVDHKPNDPTMDTAHERSRPMAEKLRAGEELNPVKVKEKPDGRFELVDGNARTLAHRAASKPMTAVLIGPDGSPVKPIRALAAVSKLEPREPEEKEPHLQHIAALNVIPEGKEANIAGHDVLHGAGGIFSIGPNGARKVGLAHEISQHIHDNPNGGAVVKEEPHPLKPNASMFRVYNPDGSPAYKGFESREEAEQFAKDIKPLPVNQMIEEPPKPQHTKAAKGEGNHTSFANDHEHWNSLGVPEGKHRVTIRGVRPGIKQHARGQKQAYIASLQGLDPHLGFVRKFVPVEPVKHGEKRGMDLGDGVYEVQSGDEKGEPVQHYLKITGGKAKRLAKEQVANHLPEKTK